MPDEDVYTPVPLDFEERPQDEMHERADAFLDLMQQRRSVRDFSDRPRNEHPYVLFPVGYPAKDADVPDLERKPLANIVQWNR